jgi:hypothetical protein
MDKINCFLKWFFLTIADRLFCGIALILSPIYSLFVQPDGNLPRFLSWFQTPDSDMFGRYGDNDFAKRNTGNTKTFLGRYWTCIKWSWRNTGQGFSTYVCGLPYGTSVTEITWVDSNGISHQKNIAYKMESPYRMVGFEFKGGWKWSKKRFFRWRIGWKMKFGQSRGFKLPYQIVLSINPWKLL